MLINNKSSKYKGKGYWYLVADSYRNGWMETDEFEDAFDIELTM
jgi:hypothetical protein